MIDVLDFVNSLPSLPLLLFYHRCIGSLSDRHVEDIWNRKLFVGELAVTPFMTVTDKRTNGYKTIQSDARRKELPTITTIINGRRQSFQKNKNNKS